MEEIIETCYTPWIDKRSARVKLSCPKKHHTLIWISKSRVQKYSSKLPKFLIGRGEYIYVIYQVGGSYEEKKTVPEVLTVAERARVVLKTTVFFPDRLFIVIVSSALLQMTQKIFHTFIGLHCEKLDQLWVPN